MVSDSLNTGRALACDVTLLRSSISRSYANLTVDREERMVLEDLDSSNESYVNGVRIAGSQYLLHGDKVQFNDVIFLVKQELTILSDEAALNQTNIVKYVGIFIFYRLF